MVKFLHTADWQLGQTLKLVGREKADELRGARLDSIRNLLALAREEDVDFIITAGDNFESNQVRDGLVRKTVRILNDYSTVPIFIIPGNHDPLMEDYPFTRINSGQLDDHVRVLTEEEPVVVPGVDATIYPGICRQKKDSHNPIGWIPRRKEDKKIRIGLAHGSWQVLPELPRDDYPIPEGGAEEFDLDYLGLGHWHSTFPDPEKNEKRTYYSGTPEPTSFSEPDSGNVLIVEIKAPERKPEVTKRRVAGYSWMTRDVTLSDETSLDGLEDELLGTEKDPGRSLLNLEVTGVTSLSVDDRFQDLLAGLKDRFFFVRADKEELNLIPTEEEVQNLSAGEGWLKGAVENLERIVSDNGDYVPEGWPFTDPPTKEEAERALSLIYTHADREGA